MSAVTHRAHDVAWGSECAPRPRRIPAGRRRTSRNTSRWIGPIAGALALLGFLLLVGGLPTARELAAVPTAAATSVRVAPNDTLWSIAKAHPVHGLDTAETVERIVMMNDLEGADLQPGTTLSIPSEASGESAIAQSPDGDRAN